LTGQAALLIEDRQRDITEGLTMLTETPRHSGPGTGNCCRQSRKLARKAAARTKPWATGPG